MDTSSITIYGYYYLKTNSLVLSINPDDEGKDEIKLLELTFYQAKKLLENATHIPNNKNAIKIILDANMKHLASELKQAVNVSSKQFYVINQMKNKLGIDEKEIEKALLNKNEARLFISKYMDAYQEQKNTIPEDSDIEQIKRIYMIFEDEEEDLISADEVEEAFENGTKAKRFIAKYKLKADRIERKNNALK